MNYKGTNFCSFSEGLEPAISPYEAVTQSIPSPNVGEWFKDDVSYLSRTKKGKLEIFHKHKGSLPLWGLQIACLAFRGELEIFLKAYSLHTGGELNSTFLQVS